MTTLQDANMPTCVAWARGMGVSRESRQIFDTADHTEQRTCNDHRAATSRIHDSLVPVVVLRLWAVGGGLGVMVVLLLLCACSARAKCRAVDGYNTRVYVVAGTVSPPHPKENPLPAPPKIRVPRHYAAGACRGPGVPSLGKNPARAIPPRIPPQKRLNRHKPSQTTPRLSF